jgi:hypothetical protein
VNLCSVQISPHGQRQYKADGVRKLTEVNVSWQRGQVGSAMRIGQRRSESWGICIGTTPFPEWARQVSQSPHGAMLGSKGNLWRHHAPLIPVSQFERGLQLDATSTPAMATEN